MPKRLAAPCGAWRRLGHRVARISRSCCLLRGTCWAVTARACAADRSVPGAVPDSAWGCRLARVAVGRVAYSSELGPGQCPVRGAGKASQDPSRSAAPCVALPKHFGILIQATALPIATRFCACGPEPPFGRLAPFTNRRARAGPSYHVERGSFSFKFFCG